jgi:hypothetical protein
LPFTSFISPFLEGLLSFVVPTEELDHGKAFREIVEETGIEIGCRSECSPFSIDDASF